MSYAKWLAGRDQVAGGAAIKPSYFKQAVRNMAAIGSPDIEAYTLLDDEACVAVTMDHAT